MKKPNSIYLFLGLAFSSSTLLVDRFLTPISDEIAIIFSLFSVAFLITFIVKNNSCRKRMEVK